jgi:hypothetical protein
MGNTGFQDQIGLLPLWDALYVATTDSRAYRSMIAHAKALHSYAIIWRDSTTQAQLQPSLRPTWSVNGAGQGGGPLPGAGSLVWENAHHGSAGYVAYLVTGDYYFVETMQSQAAACYLYGSTTWGNGISRVMYSQTRASAWCQRTIGQLAALAPLDKDNVSKEYQSMMAANAAYFNSQRMAPGQNALGIPYNYELNMRSYGETGRIAPWMQNFFVQTYGHLSDLEPLTDMSALLAVRDYLYKFPVGLLGPGTPGSYCFNYASVYGLNVSSNPSNEVEDCFDSWGEVFTATNGSAACGNDLLGGSGGSPSSGATGYWGNLLPAIAYAVDHGAPGAAAAWARLTGASNWSVIANSGFADVPIWGIVPQGYSGN